MRESLGDYKLLRRLAQGGMADIYLGRRTGLAGFTKHVAIKVLSPERAEDPDSRALFLDEARLAGLLEHENIASVLDVDVDAGVHFLAMEYVHGADLRELLLHAQRRETSLPYEVSLAIVAAAADGLDHAHRRCLPDGTPLHLVHRDVSLSNLMVGYDGAVKVVDFGIAASALSRVTAAPGLVRGKAAYMSPEQCLGDALDRRTDVFALGVVLYELTTGARCFDGATDFERMLAVVRGDYLPPHRLVPDYPRDLEAVVARALAPIAADRFPTAAALVDALLGVATAHRWALGASTIARTMRALYGEVPEPWAMTDAEIAAADAAARASAAAPEADAELSVTVRNVAVHSPRRLARGSVRFTRRGYALACDTRRACDSAGSSSAS